ncbi:hypothetical protein QTJ16_004100 [Diplocarpon rosae]|uniref:Uncharacterized protein n=1 Tax=Diplocarpon rosae TaxID=946125 RepID=A0AAD9WD25_9HELO|nr:hypothetical protein QTJ16_004100 [Diplocarpon rosae]
MSSAGPPEDPRPSNAEEESANHHLGYQGQNHLSQHRQFTDYNAANYVSPYGMTRRDDASHHIPPRATPANIPQLTQVSSFPTLYERFLSYQPPVYTSPYATTNGSRVADQTLAQAMPGAYYIKLRPTYEQMPASDQARRWMCCFSKTTTEWIRHASVSNKLKRSIQYMMIRTNWIRQAWVVGTNMCAARTCVHEQCPDCLLESVELVPDEIRWGNPIENEQTFYYRWAAMDDIDFACRTEMYTEEVKETYRWAEKTAEDVQAGTYGEIGRYDLVTSNDEALIRPLHGSSPNAKNQHEAGKAASMELEAQQHNTHPRKVSSSYPTLQKKGEAEQDGEEYVSQYSSAVPERDLEGDHGSRELSETDMWIILRALVVAPPIKVEKSLSPLSLADGIAEVET